MTCLLSYLSLSPSFAMVSVKDSSSSPLQSTEASTDPVSSNQEVSPGIAMLSPDSSSPPTPPSSSLIPPLIQGSAVEISETLAPQEIVGGVSMERAPLIITDSLVSVMSPEGTTHLSTDVLKSQSQNTSTTMVNNTSQTVPPPLVQLQVSAPKDINPPTVTSVDETQASEKFVSSLGSWEKPLVFKPPHLLNHVLLMTMIRR